MASPSIGSHLVRSFDKTVPGAGTALSKNQTRFGALAAFFNSLPKYAREVSKGLAAAARRRKPASRRMFPLSWAGLNDRGENGTDLVKNICEMYKTGDHHLLVLAASIRNLDHLPCALELEADLVTVPAKIIEAWAKKGFPIPEADFSYRGTSKDRRPLKALPYRKLDLGSA